MEHLDKTAFEFLMNKVDKELSAKGIPALYRSLHAYRRFNPTLPYVSHYQYDNSKSPYEGRNTMDTIEKWYSEHYPPEKVYAPPLGRRPFIVRSEVYKLKIPAAFNMNPNDIDFRKYVENTNEKFFNILDKEELASLRLQFNAYYSQASNIALLITQLMNYNSNLFTKEIKDLIYATKRDLNNACDSILSDHIDTNLWSIQQSVEKILKAMLLIKDRTLTSNKIKNRYGHNINKLMEDSLKYLEGLNNLFGQISLVDFSTNVRYQSTEISKYEAVISLNYAYAVVNMVTVDFLKALK